MWPPRTSVAQNVKELKANFKIADMMGVIVACSTQHFYFDGHMHGAMLTLIGIRYGHGMPLHLVLLILDMMRLGMAHVYGSAVCPAEVLRVSLLRHKDDLKELLAFFSENMLYAREKMRFKKGVAAYFFRRAMQNAKVKALMRQNINKEGGFDALKPVLHFTGVSLFEIMLLVTSEDLIFACPFDHHMMEQAQLEHMWAAGGNLTGFVRCEFIANEEERVDAWGRSGEDTMTHALSLSSALWAYNDGGSMSRVVS